MATDAPANANVGCVGPTSEKAGKSSACDGCPSQGACSSGKFNSPEAKAKEEEERIQLQQSLENVEHVVLVLSGKGGVGKSTVATQLAHTLASQGYSIGLLDVDLCGPSVPRMAGVAESEHTIHRSGDGSWTPIYPTPNLAVMSISFLLQNTDAAVVWRGPRKNALIQQFLVQTNWTGTTDGLDYLIIDTPPGTSDEHISTVQYLQKVSAISGAIVVTTPEEVSLADVRKEIDFCRKTKVNVLGVVENMSKYKTKINDLKFERKKTNGDNTDNNTYEDCTDDVLNILKEKCPEILDTIVTADVFPSLTKTTESSSSSSGAIKMANSYNIPYWGSIPLDPNLLKSCENGVCFTVRYPDSPAVLSINTIVENILKTLKLQDHNQDED